MLKPKVDPGSEEYVLEQLSLTEQKLVSLAEELSSRDLDTIHKEMADEEVGRKEISPFFEIKYTLAEIHASVSNAMFERPILTDSQ
ncbi:MAG: hypothetical protein MJE68_27495 [Proteobacteria bacterium]|nr:hypothetical protein [Pseudomonadota bacterium]